MAFTNQSQAIRLAVLGAAWAGVASIGGTPTPTHAAETSAPARGAASASVFDLMDTNRDGTLSRQEFETGYIGLQRLVAMQVHLRDRFNALDANHDQAIDAREYSQLELIRSKGKAAPPLSDFDVDHNQTLNFVEYEMLVRKMASQPTPQQK